MWYRVGAVTHPQDVFPNTERTVWGGLLGRGEDGLSELRAELMTVYAEPLRAYYLGSSYRDLGEADDVVRGFFADKFERESFMRGWALSGKRLRYWMIAGFKNHLREQVRAKMRDRRIANFDEPPEVETPDAASPESSFHRDAALAIVRGAIRESAELAASEGWTDSWHIFVQHVVEGRGYHDLAKELGLTTGSVTGRARTARQKFTRVLRTHVGWPGATDEAIDAEIEQLMEVLST